jgi:sialic acid synthase
MELIFSDQNPLIIAEVGQNHQGQPDLAFEYIDKFVQSGATAVKFQCRNNKYLFSKASYDQPYNSENAFASTYGRHREFLELEPAVIAELRAYCHENNIAFICTPFDEPSLELLVDIKVDAIKIASFDCGNVPFASLIAQTKIPTIISCGGSTLDQISHTISEFYDTGNLFSLLHCVSRYPCNPSDLNLRKISLLQSEFPGVHIGLSDHFSGISSGVVAYMLGARVFEKHVTLNRSWKGTDHSFALGTHGFGQFCRDIRRCHEMLAIDESNLGLEPVFQKLGKSVVAAKDLAAGTCLSKGDLSGKIFPITYIAVRDSSSIIGKTLKNPITGGSPITHLDLNP